MAIDRKPDDELLLNALVDGELGPSEHAAAAARLAGEREFARAYATLTRLKASVVESAEAGAPIELSLPRPRRPIKLAIAGTAALAATIAAAIYLGPLLRSELQIAAIESAPGEAVTLAALPGDPILPDLAPAGLRLTRTIVSTSRGGQTLVATYLGPRGCRLELRVRDAASAEVPAEGTDRRSWRVGSLAYELVAFGMPSARFAAVAEAAEKATRATGLPKRIDRQVREARASAPPCIT